MNPTVQGHLKSKVVWAAALLAIMSNLAPVFPAVCAALKLDPPSVQVLGSFCAALMYGLRLVTKQSLADKGAAPAAVVSPGTTGLILALVFLLPLLHACAALGTIARVVTPMVSEVIDTAVAIAVTAEITKDPLTEKIKAVAFKAIATQILAQTSAPAVGVTQLEDTLNARLVSLAPNPIIAQAVVDVIGGLQGALNIQIAKGAGSPIVKTTLVDVAGIAQQIITVCNFYGA